MNAMLGYVAGSLAIMMSGLGLGYWAGSARAPKAPPGAPAPAVPPQGPPPQCPPPMGMQHPGGPPQPMMPPGPGPMRHGEREKDFRHGGFRPDPAGRPGGPGGPGGRGGPREAREKMERLARHLELTPEQREKVEKRFREMHGKGMGERREDGEALRKLGAETRLRILEILKPEQRVEFEARGGPEGRDPKGFLMVTAEAERLARDLNLDGDQKAKVEEILRGQREAFLKRLDEKGPEHAERRDEMREFLDSLLTPEQKAKMGRRFEG